MERARQTADLVQQQHPGVPLIEVEELAEISWGIWEGKQTPNLPELLSSWEEGNYHAKSPEGESPIEVEKRAVPALYDIILNRPEKNIVFVGQLI
jgi:probable phosphoglycerate mutase